MADHNWDEAAVKKLRELRVDSSLSCSQIAKRLGVSRNAVIGKLSRLGISTKLTSVRRPVIHITKPSRVRERPGTHSENVPRLRELHAKMAEAPEVKSEPMPVDPQPICPTVTFEELEPHHCRFPFGKATPFTFCGADRREDSSYCPEHAQICSAGKLRPMNVPSHLTAIRSRRAA
jgi:GcrA cell cycle regulator